MTLPLEDGVRGYWKVDEVWKDWFCIEGSKKSRKFALFGELNSSSTILVFHAKIQSSYQILNPS